MYACGTSWRLLEMFRVVEHWSFSLSFSHPHSFLFTWMPISSRLCRAPILHLVVSSCLCVHAARSWSLGIARDACEGLSEEMRMTKCYAAVSVHGGYLLLRVAASPWTPSFIMATLPSQSHIFTIHPCFDDLIFTVTISLSHHCFSFYPNILPISDLSSILINLSKCFLRIVSPHQNDISNTTSENLSTPTYGTWSVSLRLSARKYASSLTYLPSSIYSALFSSACGFSPPAPLFPSLSDQSLSITYLRCLSFPLTETSIAKYTGLSKWDSLTSGEDNQERYWEE